MSFKEFISSTKNLNIRKNISGNRFELKTYKLRQVPPSDYPLNRLVELKAFMNSALSKKY
jgi:hypothetical protein